MQNVKEKINKVINDIPEDVLEDVLKYLKSLTNKSKEEVTLSQNLSKIIDEDKNLLEKLAE